MLFKSYVIIEVRTFSIDNLISKIRNNKIVIDKLTHIDDFIFHLRFHPKYLKKIKVIFPDYKIIHEHGLYYIIKHQLIKKTTIIALVISGLFFMYLNTLIYEVRINGKNEQLSDNIRYILENANIKRYKKKPSLATLDELKNEILSYYNEIENIDFYMTGNLVSLTYFLKEKEDIIDNSNGKYYAKKDGIVSYVDVARGNCLYEHNDYVKKGQLLIDDYVHINDKDIYVGGQGKVYAFTWSLVELKKKYIGTDTDAFSYLLQEARFQVSKQFSEKEYIDKENVLSFTYQDSMAYLKVHFTLLENIAILQ